MGTSLDQCACNDERESAYVAACTVPDYSGVAGDVQTDPTQKAAMEALSGSDAQYGSDNDHGGQLPRVPAPCGCGGNDATEPELCDTTDGPEPQCPSDCQPTEPTCGDSAPPDGEECDRPANVDSSGFGDFSC